ncbi:fused response regulator/phosphatase [Aliiglaciecola sp. CAU 1673]|uniref:ATP-binding SpoIIE family protein phosphatase n=1 Tax=Aliiglaciecola sp. CAU 1673 TaxID=3032595 RepID=UPI0023DA0252|nr:fused response regulator/phosphatase [Aliiglaciecola sp. CAU 1673]MDF2177093.1 fused response regulator/phosphatase [Aliiglaciecola sp. CAU 1673]
MTETAAQPNTVLIVEDSKVYSMMLSEFLQSKGLRCLLALSLAQARDLLSRQKVDCMLLDHHLPDGVGESLLGFMAERNLNIPVLMVTGDDAGELMQECFKHGVSDFMKKPINLELLWLKLSRFLYMHKLHHHVQAQKLELDKLLDEKHREERLARHVYEHLAENSHHSAIHHNLLSSSYFSGDLLLSRQSPSGNLLIMLVDATGHGLAAAMCILPVVSIFRAMVGKGCSLSSLAYEMNRKLFLDMPGDRFVAAVMLEIDVHRRAVHIWNGGMPEVLLLDDNGQPLQSVASSNMPLGALEAHQFDASVQSISLDGVSAIFCCSDGLLECPDDQDKWFGREDVLKLLAQNSNEALVRELESALEAHRPSKDWQDDISYCFVDIGDILSQEPPDPNAVRVSGEFVMELNLCGPQILAMDPLASLDKIMNQTSMDIELRNKAFTVCAELVTNATDHGILGVPSSLKNDADGFLVYLDKRQERAASLSEKDRLEIRFEWKPLTQEIHLSIRDSGPGYDPSKLVKANELALSGRGLALVKKICREVDCQPPGNFTKVVLS